MSDNTLKSLAEKGARLLDEERPGWADKIALHALQMSNCNMCVLGQVYPGIEGEIMLSNGYDYGLHLLDLTEDDDVLDDRTAAAYGFLLPGYGTYDSAAARSEAWDALADAWKTEIRNRTEGN